MNPFQYLTVRTPESAVAEVADHGRFLAGGIDLLGEMKDYIAKPRRLVNVKDLPGTREIVRGKSWKIGANVTVAELENDGEVRRVFPGLQQAAAEVGSPQIRNVATVGGNLAQHSRCWYYRQPDVHCLKKGGSTCYAREGENKYHSLFSGNPCISPVVSNLAVALAALDAKVIIRRGKDEVPLTISELYAKAWDNPEAHHSLGPTDLILRVEVPEAGRKSAYRQISEKSSFDWALVSCAAAAKVQGRKLSQVRIVLGAVSPVPYQVAAANELLEGKELDDTLIDQANQAILKDATPFAHNGFKIPIAEALVRRTLHQLVTSS
ncbi:MAG TPA: FAD binding domain-containing protein [Verrucomicrobiae bacterium]|nr:FAD binding domain-containing protein [Verrucomicrobiae bacterium]